MEEIKKLKAHNQKLVNENKLLKKQIENYKSVCLNDIKKFTNTTLKKEIDQLTEQKNLLLNEIENIKNNLDKKNNDCNKEKQHLQDEIEELRELLEEFPERKRKRVNPSISVKN